MQWLCTHCPECFRFVSLQKETERLPPSVFSARKGSLCIQGIFHHHSSAFPNSVTQLVESVLKCNEKNAGKGQWGFRAPQNWGGGAVWEKGSIDGTMIQFL